MTWAELSGLVGGRPPSAGRHRRGARPAVAGPDDAAVRAVPRRSDQRSSTTHRAKARRPFNVRVALVSVRQEDLQGSAGFDNPHLTRRSSSRLSDAPRHQRAWSVQPDPRSWCESRTWEIS